MFIDHYHYIIGGPLILNIIGRIAFPIFAFSLVEGFFHTRDFKKYIGRILICAIVLQAPSIIFKLDYPVNIFFTLLTGLIIMKIYHSGKIHFLIKIILIGGLTYIAKRYDFDYEIYGILTIVIFNIFRGKKILIFSSFLILNIITVLKPEIFNLKEIQIYSIFSLIPILPYLLLFLFYIPIFAYNGEKGKNTKYFFYFFYPVHFLILEGIKEIIDKF